MTARIQQAERGKLERQRLRAQRAEAEAAREAAKEAAQRAAEARAAAKRVVAEEKEVQRAEEEAVAAQRAAEQAAEAQKAAEEAAEAQKVAEAHKAAEVEEARRAAEQAAMQRAAEKKAAEQWATKWCGRAVAQVKLALEAGRLTFDPSDAATQPPAQAPPPQPALARSRRWDPVVPELSAHAAEERDGPATPGNRGETLTIRVPPSVATLRGLEKSIAEAVAKGITGQVLSLARRKKDDVQAEMHKCVEARDLRLQSFRRCAAIRRTVLLLEAAANARHGGDALLPPSSTLAADVVEREAQREGQAEAAGDGEVDTPESACVGGGSMGEPGLSKPSFLDLHRTLVEGGHLVTSYRGSDWPHTPCAFAAPPYVLKMRGEKAPTRTLHGGGYLSQDCGGEPPPEQGFLRLWEEACALWRAHSVDGRLKAALLEEVLFEVVDVQLANAAALAARRRVSEPLPPEPELAGPQPSRQFCVALADYSEALHALVRELLVEEVPPAASPCGTRPPSPNSAVGSSLSTTMCSEDHCPSRQEPWRQPRLRLRHRWPALDAHYSEAVCKLGWLRKAISEEATGRPITREAAINEFNTYCRHVGARSGASRLSYSQIARALHRMNGGNYDALCFRHAVMGRATGQLETPPTLALAEAEDTSNEQMLCFLQLLDDADDAAVSLDGFVASVVTSNYNRRR